MRSSSFKIIYGEAKEDWNSLECESSPCVDMDMEGALGRPSLMFFLGGRSPLGSLEIITD